MKKEHAGLSPSSLSLFQSCGRKYYFKKVKKLAADSDFVEDESIFNIGKAFHKICEDNEHGKIPVTADQVSGICELFKLDPVEYSAPIHAMVLSYFDCHSASKLEVVACEVEIETKIFYGIVDVILKDRLGKWWIGDLKTASSFQPAQVNGLVYHPQLNLYAAHAPLLAKKFSLNLDDFMGCRYRVTTKTKLVRKTNEGYAPFVERIRMAIRSLDIDLPLSLMNPMRIYEAHKEAFLAIQSGEQGAFRQNFNNCFSYFKPCEFWSQCNGRLYSDTATLGRP